MSWASDRYNEAKGWAKGRRDAARARSTSRSVRSRVSIGAASVVTFVLVLAAIAAPDQVRASFSTMWSGLGQLWGAVKAIPGNLERAVFGDDAPAIDQQIDQDLNGMGETPDILTPKSADILAGYTAMLEGRDVPEVAGADAAQLLPSSSTRSVTLELSSRGELSIA